MSKNNKGNGADKPGLKAVPKNDAAPVTEEKPKSEAAIKGMYQVPKDKHETIDSYVQRGMEIDRQLGVLEKEYLSRKNQLLQQSAINEKAQGENLATIAKEAGIDLETGMEKWNFDVQTKTFTRIESKVPAAVDGAPQAPATH